MTLSKEFNTSKENTLSVRFSEPEDAQTVFNFYDQNQHDDVDPIPFAKIEDRAENGRIIIFEDGNKDIIMTSLAKDYVRAGSDDDLTWTEFGGTLGTVGGLGLYPFALSSQTVNELLNTPPADRFIAVIYKSNEAVTNLLNQKVGWNIYEPDTTLVKDFKAVSIMREDEATEDLNFLECSSAQIPFQARLILDFVDEVTQNGLKQRKTETVFSFDFSRFPLVNEYAEATQALAYGSFAEKLENSDHIPLNKVREDLVTYLQQTGKLDHIIK